MMDQREDKLDALLRDAAQDYNAPPVPPRAEMWAKIAAERQRGSGTVGQEPRKLPQRRTAALPLFLGLAALLALGVAIGRFTASGNPGTTAPAAAPAGLATAPGTPDSSVPSRPRERGAVAAQLATVQHLGQVEDFLTEFNARNAAQDFSPQAKGLLGTTRLLLDSKRITNPQTRKLLEDLELVLMQIVTLNPKDRREDLDLIADGLSQSHLRSRLRSAIPAGPAIRM